MDPKKLRVILAELDLAPGEFLSLIGRSRQTLLNWRHGRTTPRESDRRRIGDVHVRGLLGELDHSDNDEATAN